MHNKPGGKKSWQYENKLYIVSPWSSDTIKRIHISYTSFFTFLSNILFFCFCYKISGAASCNRNENDLRVRSLWKRPFTVTSHCLSCRDATTKKSMPGICLRLLYIRAYIYMAGEEDKHISQPQRVSSYYTVNGKWATAKGILIIRRLFGSAFKCYTPKGRATVHQPWWQFQVEFINSCCSKLRYSRMSAPRLFDQSSISAG